MTMEVGATSCKEASRTLTELYGLTGECERLPSERDEIFHVTASDGREFTLRFANAAEPVAVTDFQCSALQWLEARDACLPVQRLVPTRDGAPFATVETSDGLSRAVRLLTYLTGLPLIGTVRTPAQRSATGTVLGNLTRALDGFRHSADGHELVWDLKRLPLLRKLIPSDAGSEWSQPARCIDEFERRVVPVLDQLPQQVVHNDFNLHNILVDAGEATRIVGILDFGDMVRTARVFDVAIAASYHLDADAPLAGPCTLIEAYHQARPLALVEAELLFTLLRARMAATIIITEWRAQRYPANRAYIRKNTLRAWDGLALLAHLPEDRAEAELLAACGFA